MKNALSTTPRRRANLRRFFFPAWPAVAAALLLIGSNVPRAHAQEGRSAVIDDSDGYTNVRAHASKQSAIVTTVHESERFMVYPTNESWWAVRTAAGETGYMHRSCVRLLDTDSRDDAGSQAAATLRASGANAVGRSIRKDDATLAAWKEYSEAMEAARISSAPLDPKALLPHVQSIALVGVDPRVAELITDCQSYLKRLISGNARVAEEQDRLQPTLDTYEALREPARSVGASLMPTTGVPSEYQGQTGAAIGELLLLYCFSDQLRSHDLPDAHLMTLEGDQIVVRESLINASLGMEQPLGVKRWLVAARNRSYAERLLAGRWVCHNADGKMYDLEFKTNDVVRRNGCGWVTLKARGRPRQMFERDFFKWQFDGDDFYMIAAGIIDDAQGVQPRKLRGIFITPNILKIYDEHEELIGTWERN